MSRFDLRAWDTRRWDLVALAAIAAGILARILWILVFHRPFDNIYSDMLGYVSRAKDLADGRPLGHYASFYPPGTHLLLAIPFLLLGTHRAGLWGAAVLWCTLSSLTPFFVWRFSRIVLTPAAAALAALLCAAWPLFVTYGGYFSSETPATALLAAAIWLGFRARRAVGRAALGPAVGSGLLGASAMACRPQLTFNMLVLGVPLLFGRGKRFATAGALAAGALVVIVGVVVHNSIANHKFTPALNQDTGFVFFMGQCNARDIRTDDFRRNLHFEFGPPPLVQKGGGNTYHFANRVVWDEQFFVKGGLKCLRHDGVAHTMLITRSIADMTATTVPWPQVNDSGVREVVTVANFLYALALPIIIVLGIGLARRRRTPGRPSGEGMLLAQLACVLLVALIAFGDPRFRTPYDIFGLSLLGAVLADRFFDRPRESR